MSRIQNILEKAERDGGIRRMRGPTPPWPSSPTGDDVRRRPRRRCRCPDRSSRMPAAPQPAVPSITAARAGVRRASRSRG